MREYRIIRPGICISYTDTGPIELEVKRLKYVWRKNYFKRGGEKNSNASENWKSKSRGWEW